MNELTLSDTIPIVILPSYGLNKITIEYEHFTDIKCKIFVERPFDLQTTDSNNRRRQFSGKRIREK